MSEEITLIMSKIAELAAALNVTNINNLPGCWLHHIDGHWTIAVNGHSQDEYATPPGMPRMNVRPFEAAIWYNGWPAGYVWAQGGTLANGSRANEDALLHALEKAIEKAMNHEQ